MADQVTGQDLQLAASALGEYLLEHHWTGSFVAGPDPGVRFNTRIGRFVKSYSRWLPWRDDLVYMQAQSYWVLDNWLLADGGAGSSHADVAVQCSEAILDAQQPEGYWIYPNPEWRGRVATVEGCFASLALLESFAHTGRDEFLAGSLRWHDYAEREVGFRRNPIGMAINYFATGHAVGGGVPNNATLYLWFLAALAFHAGDSRYLSRAKDLIAWLADVQLPSGELPYAVASPAKPGKDHFLCYQYNAFEFMDLLHYHELTDDDSVLPIIAPLARYLASGVRSDGAAKYSCLADVPTVTYYTAAVGQALSQATTRGYDDYQDEVNRAYAWLLARQARRGNFKFHSARNYRWLADRRSYPRYLTMILHHLLLEQRRRNRAPEEAQL